LERQKTWIREDKGDWNEFKKPPLKWIASRFWLVENLNLVVRDWILCCLYLWGFHKREKCWVQMDNLTSLWEYRVQESLFAVTPLSLKQRDTRAKRSLWREWMWIHLFYSDRVQRSTDQLGSTDWLVSPCRGPCSRSRNLRNWNTSLILCTHVQSKLSIGFRSHFPAKPYIAITC